MTSDALKAVKDWFGFAVAIVVCISGIIFWIQQADNDKFEHIEHEISSLKSDIDNIRKNNNEILRIVGRLEGKLE